MSDEDLANEGASDLQVTVVVYMPGPSMTQLAALPRFMGQRAGAAPWFRPLHLRPSMETLKLWYDRGLHGGRLFPRLAKSCAPSRSEAWASSA